MHHFVLQWHPVHLDGEPLGMSLSIAIPDNGAITSTESQCTLLDGKTGSLMKIVFQVIVT